GKALFDRLPPIDQAIHQTIAENAGGDPVEKELIGGRQENTDWRHPGLRVKIMVGGLGEYATGATTCKRADLDCRLGIHREPYDLLIGIGLLVDLLQLDKDGIGFGQFFWG